VYWQWLSDETDITTSVNAHEEADIARLWSTDHRLLATFVHVATLSKSGKSVGKRWEFVWDNDGTMSRGEAMQHLKRELNT
jgi:hypothetical protein